MPLSFFSEIRGSESGGGLILTLFAHAYHHKYDYGDDIGEHFEKLLGAESESGDIVVNYIKRTEEEGAEDAGIRLPEREYNERDGEPSAVAEAFVRPDAVGVVHYIIKSAESRDDASDAGGKVLIAAHVDACRIGGGGAFAHSAQLKTNARALEHICGDKSYDYGKVGHKAV